MNNLYLTRYAYPVEHPKMTKPPDNLGLVIVIPCYNEQNIIDTIESINSCQPPDCAVEVIVIINHPESSPDEIVSQNKETLIHADQWAINYRQSWLTFHFLPAFDLPLKKAGVGLARKIGMDEAVRRFLTIHNSMGIIASLDADCLCDTNYIVEIINHFKNNPGTNGALVYFEHSLEGNLSREIYEGIVAYELHLRYMVNALKSAGYPYAFQTMGSCMVIPMDIYQKQGGMNTRKAGEDFYFLHKIFPLGNISEINNTRVIPSPRISERVPFGTGKAMKKLVNDPNLQTYNPLIYNDLALFIYRINSLFGQPRSGISNLRSDVPQSLMAFLREENWTERIHECYNSSQSYSVYQYRIFNWFSGLKIVKYLNFARSNYYPDVHIKEAACWLLENRIKVKISNSDSMEDLLKIYRKIDRKGV